MLEDREMRVQMVNTLLDTIKEEVRNRDTFLISDFVALMDEFNSFGIDLNVRRTLAMEDGVVLTTAHSSKGLEFKKVFIIKAVEKNWEKRKGPSSGYVLPPNCVDKVEKTDLEEDNRRLFFVAMTRAENELFITFPRLDEKGKDLVPSKFVSEIVSMEDIASPEISNELVMGYEVELLQKTKVEPQAWIPRELLQDWAADYRLSASDFNSYLRCPTAFYFTNVLRAPQKQSSDRHLGIAVHKALEVFNRKMKEEGSVPELRLLLDAFKVSMERQRAEMEEGIYKNNVVYGEQLLQAYFERYENDFHSEILVEEWVDDTVVGNVPMKGKIDLISIYEGAFVKVVDYKTAKKSGKKVKPPKVFWDWTTRPTQLDLTEEVLGSSFWRQIAFYFRLVEGSKKFSPPLDVQNGEIDYVNGRKTEDFLKDESITILPEEFTYFDQLLAYAYSGITNLQFEDGCNDDNCQWCKLRDEIS